MWAIIGLVSILWVLVVARYRGRFQYWKKRNIPYIEPSIPFGNLENPFRRSKSFAEFLQDMYEHFRSRGDKHGGIYTFMSPVYMPVHPDYIRNVMADYFSYFPDRGIFFDEKRDPLLLYVLGSDGPRWKGMRNGLTPAFSIANIKTMLPILTECCQILKKALDGFADRSEPVEMKDMMIRFTTDVIGSCGFGLNCHAVAEEESQFRRLSRSLFHISKLANLKFTVASSFPTVGRLLGVKLVPDEDGAFVTDVVRRSVDERKRNGCERVDFFQMLMRMKRADMEDPGERGEKAGDPEETLSLQSIASVCLGLFTAGFETSSTLLAYAMLELCLHPQVQEETRREIEEVLEAHGGQLSYEAMFDMKYLEQVLEECLRLHPPVSFLKRICVKDFRVPGTDVVIEKGTSVVISVFGIHMNEEYYPDPERFDPSRFTKENKSSRPPYTFIPFSRGPRTCMGVKFAMLESKLAVVTMLKNYRFSLDPRTTVPPTQDKYSYFFTSPATPIWLRVESI